MDLDTAFKILELEKSADISEIRTAYRDLVQVWHPDKFTHNSRLTEKAAAKMQDINCAYDIAQEYFKNNESSFKERAEKEPKKKESFGFIVCVNCGTKNRVSKKVSNKNLRCGKCGKNLKKKEPQHKKGKKCADESCGGTMHPGGRCDKCGRTTDEVKRGTVDSNDNCENYHPWRRFFARAIDTIWGSLPAIPIIFVLMLLFPNRAELLENSFIMIAIIFVSWCPFEAVLLSTIGTTPARFLFGISVRTTSGQKLSFDQALGRSAQVLLQGEGLGVPFVALFTRFFAYRRLVRTGTTLWDTTTGSVVSHKKMGPVRAFLCMIAVLLVLFLTGLANDYQQQQTKELGSESQPSQFDHVTSTSPSPDRIIPMSRYRQEDYQARELDHESVLRDRPAPKDSILQGLRLIDQGREYSRTRQYAKAVNAYQQAIRVSPDFVDAWSNLGLVYIDINEYAKAIETLHQAIRIKPARAELWTNLGLAYIHINEYGKAIKASQQAIRIKPDIPEAWYNLGLAYAYSGQTDKMMDAYTRLKTIDSGIADTFFNKIVSQHRER